MPILSGFEGIHFILVNLKPTKAFSCFFKSKFLRKAKAPTTSVVGAAILEDVVTPHPKLQQENILKIMNLKDAEIEVNLLPGPYFI